MSGDAQVIGPSGAGTMTRRSTDSADAWASDTAPEDMLTTLHRHLRRHRSQAIALLAVVVLAAVGAGAHAALMNGAMDDHMAGSATSICLVVGAALAVMGAAVLGTRRTVRGPTWSPLRLVVAVAPVSPTLLAVPVRAGPSSLLQVFRF